MKRKKRVVGMKKYVLRMPEGITQCIVLCVLRRQDNRCQNNLRFSSWDQGFRGIEGFPSRKSWWRQIRTRGSTGLKEQQSKYLKAVLRGCELCLLLERNSPHLFSWIRVCQEKTLHRYYKERQNHWKYFQVWVLPQMFCKSREKYWSNMQICYSLFLLLEARGHVFKQQPWIFH